MESTTATPAEEKNIDLLSELTAPTDKDAKGQPDEVTTEPESEAPEQQQRSTQQAPTERPPEQKVFTTVKTEARAFISFLEVIHSLILDHTISKGKYDLSNFKTSKAAKEEMIQTLSDILNERGQKMNPYLVLGMSALTAYGINSYMAYSYVQQQQQREREEEAMQKNTDREFLDLLNIIDEQPEPEEETTTPAPEPAPKKTAKKKTGRTRKQFN